MKAMLFQVLALVLPTISLALNNHDFLQDQTPFNALKSKEVKVPVTLGVMSKCPDALLCESVFDDVLDKVIDKVDFKLTYIGKINSSEPDFGVTCMHGPDECAGNVQQLCAAKYAEEPKDFWAFVQCQNFEGRDKVGSADLALKCAKTANIKWEDGEVGKCAGKDGSGRAEEGVNLLVQSVKRTQKLGITKSCTVMINGRQVCIHDGTWKDCEAGHAPEDFIDQINSEYEYLNKVQ